MSRVAKMPIALPKGVQIDLTSEDICVTGPKGKLNHKIPSVVNVTLEDGHLNFSVVKKETLSKDKGSKASSVAASSKFTNPDALAGTTRALVSNMVHGVSQGYEKKLILVGVGYRAKIEGNSLALTLGFSHPVNFPIPQGITIEAPILTEVIVRGVDKQLVGETAAKIRGYRPPEPYKGKGIRYSDEVVKRKETKKK
jgi:large subunit ribosomal protein L6